MVRATSVVLQEVTSQFPVTESTADQLKGEDGNSQTSPRVKLPTSPFRRKLGRLRLVNRKKAQRAQNGTANEREGTRIEATVLRLPVLDQLVITGKKQACAQRQCSADVQDVECAVPLFQSMSCRKATSFANRCRNISEA